MVASKDYQDERRRLDVGSQHREELADYVARTHCFPPELQEYRDYVERP